jgi:hypothetical protein
MKDSGGERTIDQSETGTYRAILYVNRYRDLFIPFAFLSMALFHFPLFLNRKVSFYKLMGCGKNGTFDIHPDFKQWALMIFYRTDMLTSNTNTEILSGLPGRFINFWWNTFSSEVKTFHLEPVAGHGTWDGRTFLEEGKTAKQHTGRLAVLTRATIRLSRLRSFWNAVPGAANKFEQNPGFIYSVGIGEIPFIKQATFSIWESEEEMRSFAYRHHAHRDVIRRTKEERWYSEEMFLRFRILD